MVHNVILLALEVVCRICAAASRGKYNSPLKTTSLFLYPVIVLYTELNSLQKYIRAGFGTYCQAFFGNQT